MYCFSLINQLFKEVRRWPYDFVGSKDFLPPNQRGIVSGKLQVQDRYKPTTYLDAFKFFSNIYIISYKENRNSSCFRIGKAQPAKNAYVGLALPGNAGSWQKECKVQDEFEPMKFNSLN